eukprot:756977-Hanusia_phi.AAC.4
MIGEGKENSEDKSVSVRHGILSNSPLLSPLLAMGSTGNAGAEKVEAEVRDAVQAEASPPDDVPERDEKKGKTKTKTKTKTKKEAKNTDKSEQA